MQNHCIIYYGGEVASCRELDHAMLRRLEKRILVDLPSQPARLAMLKHHLPPVIAECAFPISTDIDYEEIAQVGHSPTLLTTHTRIG